MRRPFGDPFISTAAKFPACRKVGCLAAHHLRADSRDKYPDNRQASSMDKISIEPDTTCLETYIIRILFLPYADLHSDVSRNDVSHGA
jgi:hypothetical protein